MSKEDVSNYKVIGCWQQANRHYRNILRFRSYVQTLLSRHGNSFSWKSLLHRACRQFHDPDLACSRNRLSGSFLFSFFFCCRSQHLVAGFSMVQQVRNEFYRFPPAAMYWNKPKERGEISPRRTGKKNDGTAWASGKAAINGNYCPPNRKWIASKIRCNERVSIES